MSRARLESKLKVLHITEALGGGVLNSVIELSKKQIEDDFEVFLAHSFRKDTPILKELKKLLPSKVQRITLPMVTNISPLNDLYSLFLIIRLLRGVRPDFLHLHSSKAGFLGRLASKLSFVKTKVFYSPRGFPFLKQDVSFFMRLIYVGLEKIALFFGGRIIACSASEGLAAKSFLNAKSSQVQIIENCVNPKSIHKIKFKKNTSKKLKIVTSGRICYQKAPWIFLKLASEFPQCDFIWIGDGELKNKLTDIKNFPKNLIITGWISRDEVIQKIGGSDIFILCSLWEGMSISLIEAQILGLPCIVSRCVGNMDIVEDGINGYVCENYEDFKKKLKYLISNGNIRRKFSSFCLKNSESRFSPDRMYREIQQIYFD
jgi:glycosyltransferase involved in cell wall biosynthesis